MHGHLALRIECQDESRGCHIDGELLEKKRVSMMAGLNLENNAHVGNEGEIARTLLPHFHLVVILGKGAIK